MRYYHSWICCSYLVCRFILEYAQIKTPNKPLLKSADVREQAIYDDSKEIILDYLNRDKAEADKRSELPDSVHSLFDVSNYNMNRQQNRLLKRVGAVNLPEKMKEIELLIPDLCDPTNTKFSMETSTFVFEQESDVYLCYLPDLKYLKDYQWVCDGTFKLCKNTDLFSQLYIISLSLTMT